ncbi:hypothetical protein O181_051261 [Austropuccinia psidii MF-1]|uniref:Uncharacterized protein n=1 Tax=Austropuccinia psidii MF-1 TaxID=1389203 RepID=A0A9Q3DW30_9BASI|nr:hypothetical protein [Austropuccinia psidii MF-1]
MGQIWGTIHQVSPGDCPVDEEDLNKDPDYRDDHSQSSSTSGWRDITSTLIRGSHQLAKNDIIISTDLSLIEIISAIQIMDPRMDVGVGSSNPKSPSESFDPAQALTPQEVITIMDLSLNCEVTWYSGHMLSQTLMISNYLRHVTQLRNHPDPIIQVVLRSYLLGLIKCCGLVSDEILSGNLRENEDINTDGQRFDCHEEVSISDALNQLDQAHEFLTCNNELSDYRIGLMERVRFRIEYLYSLACISSSPLPSSIFHLQDHLLSASEALKAIVNHSTSITVLSFTLQSNKIRSAFDLSFSRTVSSSSPPRPVQFHESLDDLISATLRVIHELFFILQMTRGSSVSVWKLFFTTFSRRDPMPFPQVRSYILSLFQNSDTIALDRTHTLLWLAKDCISNLSAGQIQLDYNAAGMRYIQNRFAGLIVNHLSAFAANRARGRRILFNSLKEWRSLYDATFLNQLDVSLPSIQAFQMIIYYFSVESSLQAILMGFDQDLYVDDDDRIAMWWVVTRLSERICRLLRIVTRGQEILELKLTKVIGLLAWACAQIVQRKIQDPRRMSLVFRKTIFERRIKNIISRQSIFEEAELFKIFDQLESNVSPQSHFDHYHLLDFEGLINFAQVDSERVEIELLKVRNSLSKISQSEEKEIKVIKDEFQLFIDTLLKLTNRLISENHQDFNRNSKFENRFQNLTLYHKPIGEDLNNPQVAAESNKNEGNDYPRLMIIDNSFLKIYNSDVSFRWFLI